MAYLGNQDLGQALQVGGSIYSNIEEDFEERVNSASKGGSLKNAIKRFGRTWHRVFTGRGGMQDAEQLGEAFAHLIAEENPELLGSGVLTGGNFWNDLKKGFKKAMKAVKKVSPIIKKVAPIVAPVYGTALTTGMNLVGLGKNGEDLQGDGLLESLRNNHDPRFAKMRSHVVNPIGGKKKKPRKKRAMSDKMNLVGLGKNGETTDEHLQGDGLIDFLRSRRERPIIKPVTRTIPFKHDPTHTITSHYLPIGAQSFECIR